MFRGGKARILVKLIVILTTIIALSSAFSALYIGEKNNSAMREMLRSSIANLAAIGELGYSSLVWSTNENPLYVFNTAMLDNPNVVAVNVYEDQNFLSGLSKDLQTYRIDPKSRNQRFVIPENESDIRAVSAEIRYEGRLIGKFELFYTQRFIQEEIRQRNFNLIVAFALTTLLTIAVTFLVIRRSLIQPVLKLADFSRGISLDQEHFVAIAKPADDEIGFLYDSFNVMLQNIRVQKTALRKTIADLEQAEQKYRSIFENALEGIFQSSPDGQLITANPTLAHFLGYDSPADLIAGINSQHTQLYVDPGRRQEFLERILTRGHVADFEFAAFRKDGAIIEIQMNAHLVRNSDGSISHFEGMLKDITERKRAEREVQRYREQLENMVRERTEDLDRKNQALNETVERLQATLADLQRTQGQLVHAEKMAALGSLVAGFSHELNTPIGNALMVASTLPAQTERMSSQLEKGLRRSALEDFLGEMRNAGEMMVRNLARAAELISSFKQVAMDQTTSQRRPFTLNELVSEIVITLTPTLKKTPYRIETDIPADIALDSYPGPLGQVITNLINNAVLHGFDGAPKGRISVSADRVDAGHCWLQVCDDGKGIPPEHLNSIFDPFFTTKLGRGGSGIGLSISYSIVTGVLGGRIEVESTPNTGTRFTLTLPTSAPERISETLPD